MNNDWYECGSCEEDFKVIAHCNEPPEYCPFCGANVDVEIPDELDFEDE